MAPLVSIGIVALDYASYLAPAVRSALAQTHPSIEIVLGVGFGHAPTEAVLAELAGEPRVRVCRTRMKRFHLGKMRRFVFARARGKFLLMLDSDDLLHPTAVTRLLSSLAPGEAIAVGRVEWMTPDGRRAGTQRRARVPRHASVEVFGNQIYPSATLARRAAIAKVGGYSSRRAIYADDDLYQRIPPRAIRFVRAVVARHREHPKSLTTDERFGDSRLKEGKRLRARTISRYFGASATEIAKLL